MPKFYITTPIYYVNAEPHIGHTYTTVAADVLARYHRLIGDKTFFLTGTDEHGEKNEEIAKKKGVSPQEHVDEISAKFQMAWDRLDISNDGFIRTTDPAHIKAVQKALQYMYDKGYIYKGRHEGLYCVGCEQYKTEKDLVDGLCPDHKKAPKERSEECYMFKLSAFADELKEKIQSGEMAVYPESRKNEILSFYEQGLKDISFSRKDTKWGVPLPWDETQVAYVWPDAFLNYLTGLGWDGTAGKAPEAWPPEAQLMAKDIIRVHATIWPAMLLALELPLPKILFSHGFFLIDGQKMSKSIGNVIAPNDLIDKYGVDGAKYLLMSATTFGHDGDIGWEKFDEKYNADLANGIGNLVSRVLAMTEKYLLGKVPPAAGQEIGTGWENYEKYLNGLEIHKALEHAWGLISECDEYVEKNKPWEMAKNNIDKLPNVLYNLLETIRHIAWMAYPFMPETAEKILSQLGVWEEEKQRSFNKIKEWGGLKEGNKVQKGEGLFMRIQ